MMEKKKDDGAALTRRTSAFASALTTAVLCSPSSSVFTLPSSAARCR
eukprot:COSAG06_NODE_64158_length_260_cov_0.645963_1_plen_46_part_10